MSCGEGADLDEVVGEDAVSAPGSGSVDAGEFGAVPAVASFDVVDPSFGSGPPFDLLAECSSVFEFAARGAGFTRAWDRYAAHAKIVQVAFHRCLAVAAVGGDRPWGVSGAGGDACDRRDQLRGICGVADLDGVIEDDPVGIVDDLGFVAELDRFAQAPFADRAGIEVMQADHPARRLGHHPAQAATGLGHNAFGASDEGVQTVDRPVQPAFAVPGRGAQRPSGVADHCGGFDDGRFGDPGQLAGDPAYRGLGLIALLFTAQLQLGGDRTGPPPAALIRATLRAIEPIALANRPESVG
jgi:hypothetical protein